MQLTGFGVGTRIAIGPVVRMPDPLPEPVDEPASASADVERERALAALAETAAELGVRASQAEGSAREVLEAAAMMAGDPSLSDMVASHTAQGRTAERAVFEAFASFARTLRGMGGYMAERASDLADVSQRVVARLMGVPAPEVPQREEPFVLVAHDLAPADTAKLDLTKVLALVTRDGSPKAHTGILASEKGLPAVVAVAGADGLRDGQTVVVDAAAGTVTADPDEALLERARAEMERQAAIAAAPLTPGALADGTPVQLLANVGKPADAARAVELGAEGVGLFRTEFLFLDAERAPSVEEQRTAYAELFSHFPGKKVVARVLDAGADKPLSFLTDSDEPNPALGLRGLRALRAKEQLLREQLTALAQAAAQTEAELWVMAPMVSDAEESAYFTGLARQLGIRTAGSMIEVPSAAILAEQILRSSDFLSIGTNDLTQYAMAADRLLGTVASFQDPWHPAVLRLIRTAGEAGAAADRKVGVCGEAAADPRLAIVLVGLGITSLSMAPPALAQVRAALAGVTLAEARERAERALAADSAQAARQAAG